MPHGSGQVSPAAHVSVLPPLHFTVHVAVEPQSIMQPALPEQSAVHSPSGQAILQVLLPPQVSVEPAPRVMSHVEPPPHVTLLFLPAMRLQLLVPSHVDVQLEPHVALQVDWPPHVVVQPVPQVALQVFFVLQS
jgi:hypothetical protein